MAPLKPYYYVTHDYGPETVSSKAEICIPNGQSPPERMAMPFVPSLKDLSEGDADTLLSVIQSLRQHNGVMADVDHVSPNRDGADIDHVLLNQYVADIDHASHTYGDDGDKGNATTTILASDKRDASEDRCSRKREHDRKMATKKRCQQKEYIRSLEEQRDSLVEKHIMMMELSKRNKQLEDEKAQLQQRLSMLEREGMVQTHTLDFDIANMYWGISY
ncbi:hypothetical protein V492_00230 [Pseudogymnoascus sp. VKM F-4246]|nr:hypothetical protein V492_00230 [Pseudogymnoascus sp. VKM F-4246]